MYSCSKPLFCIYPKSHTDSSIMSQPLLLHNGTTALKSPGSITTGCLWQCQERAGSKDNCAGITQCLQLLLNTQKPLQSGICDRVDGRGYCCFLPTRKSFLLLTSLHATTCDFCHNSTRIKCHSTCLYWNFPILQKYLFPSFWDFSVQNNISISSFGIA